jgi:hypothetical protein
LAVTFVVFCLSDTSQTILVMEILYDHDALPLGAILGALSCPRSILSVGVVRGLQMMMKASDSMSFINLGVESKVAHCQNPRLVDIRVPTERAKNDIQPRDFIYNVPDGL